MSDFLGRSVCDEARDEARAERSTWGEAGRNVRLRIAGRVWSDVREGVRDDVMTFEEVQSYLRADLEAFEPGDV